MNLNMMIMPIYLLSIIFSLSSSSWLMIWMGMELNLLNFIFIILKKNSLLSTESSIKYFIIQTIGSLIFIISINMNMLFYNESFNLVMLTPPLALMIKSGMAPFHSWIPPIVSKFSYESLFLFLTFQKLIPIFIIFSSWFNLSLWICLINIFMGSMSGISQSLFSKMLIFSSLNNMGWLMLSFTQSLFLFMVYFFTYFLMNFIMINFMKINKIKWIIQINSNKMSMKMLYFSFILSLSGIPPFLGFMPKWLMIKKMIFFMPAIALISIIFSIFTLFFYLKTTFIMILTSSSMKKWNLNMQMKIWFFMLMSMNLFSPLIFFLMN